MTLIKMRRGTWAEWGAANPILAAGEIGFEIDANKIKIGNGTDDWSTLSYIAGSGGGGTTWGAITGTLSSQTDLQTALDGKQAAGSYAASSHTHAQSDVTGLVADLAAKAPLASPTFTGTVSGITAAMVGAPSGSGTSTGTNTGDQTDIPGNAETVTTINGRISAGTNITLGGTGTAADPYVVNASGGGGSSTWTIVEKDLGSNARLSGKITITGLSGLTVGKPVAMHQAVGPYTGKGTLADECEMDEVSVNASVTATDTITAYWKSQTFVKGNFKFNYMVGA